MAWAQARAEGLLGFPRWAERPIATGEGAGILVASPAKPRARTGSPVAPAFAVDAPAVPVEREVCGAPTEDHAGVGQAEGGLAVFALTTAVPAIPMRQTAAQAGRSGSGRGGSLRAACVRSRISRAAEVDPGPLPLAVHCRGGCLGIEVCAEFGPAAGPHLGRLPHRAIRPVRTAVLVDLRHTADVRGRWPQRAGAGAGSANRHGLMSGPVGEAPRVPALPGTARPSTDRAAADGATGGRLPCDTVSSALPPGRPRGRH